MASTGAGHAAVNAGFLSEADDLCSRVMLDICVFDEDKVEGRRTGKMNAKDARETRLREEDLKLTRDTVKQLRAGKVTASDAAHALSKTGYYRSFVGKWDDDDEDLFTNHLKRYCHALRPDSGIAFHETDRYSKGLPKSAAVRQTPSPTPPPVPEGRPAFIEVGVFATRDFKKGEIVNLRGGVADLSEEEDDKMREGGGRSDFSVLWSERKKCFGLLLGPARFVNHDCRNNVQFHLTGANMTFKVIEDIKADEELFTHYGEHYFDTDNNGCMCATCQKLKRGAFTPKVSKFDAKRAAHPAAGSPRRAGRSSLGGHEVTAQRSVGRGARRSSIPDEDKRRSERTSLVPDELRSGPRHVHPRLKPPPLYASDYDWDSKKKTAKYTGIVHCPQTHKPKPPPEKVKKSSTPTDSPRNSPAKSKVALGKRKREDSRSESPTSTPPRATKKKVLVSRIVELKKVAIGSRASSRASASQGSASARSRAFDKLKLAMGEQADSDESLTELESSDDDGSDDGALLIQKIGDAVEGKRPILVVHSEKKTKGARGVQLDVTRVKSPADSSDDDEVAALLLRDLPPRSSMVPDKLDDPSRAPSPSIDPFNSDFIIEGSYARRSPRRDPPPLHPQPPGKKRRAAAADSTGSSSNGTSAPTASTSNDSSSSTRQELRGQSFQVSRSSLNQGGVTGGSGSGGDDGDERRNGKRLEKADEAMRMDVEEAEGEEENRFTVKEEEREDEEMPTPASVAPSEGGRDTDTREAAAFLLMLRAVPSNLDASSSSSSSDPSTPNNGAGSSKAPQKRGRPSLEVDPHANPRSTRRNSQLEEPAKPAASGSGSSGRSKSRPTSQTRTSRPSDSTPERKARPSLLGPHCSSNEGESGSSRSTRRSAPLAGTLADMLKDPAVMSVAGGFDPVAGRYVARGRVAEGPEPPPLPPPPAPPTPPPRPATAPAPHSAPKSTAAAAAAARPTPRPRPVSLHSGDLRRFAASSIKERRASSGAAPRPTNGLASPSTPSSSSSNRSTRLSAPIHGSLNQLIASPAVAAVAGGYDFEAGRYTSTRRLVSTSAPSTPVAAGPAPSTPAPTQASPAESSRGTRSRAPLAGMTVADLVASPEARAVSGGYNPATGKYIGARKRGTAAGSPPVGQPRA